MNIEYKRDLRQSYMILSGEKNVSEYEEQMLRANEIRALLSFYTIQLNHQIQFWYDITGKRSLRDYFDQEGITIENLNMLMLYLSIAYDQICKYLIAEEHIYLSPDTVFLEQQGEVFLVFLCYCPFGEGTALEQLQSIMEYLISSVDHSKQEITKICYGLYELSLKQGVSLAALKEYLQENTEKDEVISHRAVDCKEEAVAEEESETWIEDEESWEDVFEEEEKQSLMQKVKSFFLGLVKEKVGQVQSKKEQLFPSREDYEDIIYDPTESFYEPTTLLHKDAEKCMGKLLYEGNQQESDHLINKEVFHIGSKEEGNDAVLHSSVVSRSHAKIVKQGTDYYIEDLNSKNGTYVNGKMLNYKEKLKLNMMDQIVFADVAYRIV